MIKERFPERVATSDIVFRQATVKDAEAMDALNRKCLPENYPLMEWRTILTMMPTLSFVGYDGTNLVGYCLGMYEVRLCEPNRACARSEFSYPKGTIASIAVDTQHRRRGIARELLLRSTNAMTHMGCKHVSLNVRMSNLPAQTMYKELGFRKHQTLQRYYQNGEDAYLMRKMCY